MELAIATVYSQESGDILEGLKVTKAFGGLVALKDVDFIVEEGTITGLIGPNGAGKTTLFNVATGFYRPTSGRIMFLDEEITGLRPHEICRKGMAMTFQITHPFSNVSVLKNVMIGGLFGRSKGLSMADARNDALQFLDFVGLTDKKDISIKHLTFVDKKLVDLATVLNTKPKIVLLDEFISGLSPTETNQAMNLIKHVRNDLGVTVFWVEHIMRALMEIADCIIVLHHGEKLAMGRPKEICASKKVCDAYLGEEYMID